MRKIKKIATSGIVGTLLFVSSGVVRAQDTALPSRSNQRNEIPDLDISEIEDLDVDVDIGVSAKDEVNETWSQTKDTLIEQGFSASQIQKLSRRGYGYEDN